MSVRSILLVELLKFLFGVFGGMCGENSCSVFPLLFMVLWVPVSVTLWHASLFLGLGPVGVLFRAQVFPLLLFAWGSPLLFLVRKCLSRKWRAYVIITDLRECTPELTISA
jgi:hypothetical protein